MSASVAPGDLVGPNETGRGITVVQNWFAEFETR